MKNKLIGSQISFTLAVFEARKNPVNLGAEDLKERQELFAQYSKVIMQIVVSLIILIASVYILLNHEDDTLQKAASSFIGTVIGYWLR